MHRAVPASRAKDTHDAKHSRLEKQMKPSSEATKLESSGTFVEYVGSGKLKDKKVLITGGEYELVCLRIHT